MQNREIAIAGCGLADLNGHDNGFNELKKLRVNEQAKAQAFERFSKQSLF